jgi:hypothetical protein
MTWSAKAANGTWYCFREEFRIPENFICRTEERARACALALNAIERINRVTFGNSDEGIEICDSEGRAHVLVRALV